MEKFLDDRPAMIVGERDIGLAALLTGCAAVGDEASVVCPGEESVEEPDAAGVSDEVLVQVGLPCRRQRCAVLGEPAEEVASGADQCPTLRAPAAVSRPRSAFARVRRSTCHSA